MAFLVISGDAAWRWAIDIVHVETVLDAAAPAAVDEAQLGVAGDGAAAVRVVQLRAGARHGGIAVRGRLSIVTVAATAVQALPPVLVAAMPRPVFAGVAVAGDDIAFLILDVASVLQEAA